MTRMYASKLLAGKVWIPPFAHVLDIWRVQGVRGARRVELDAIEQGPSLT